MANSSNDKAVKVVRDAAGDIIVTGDSDDGVNGFDMLTIKYSRADGSVLWQRRYNNPAGGSVNADEVRALAVDGQGNVVVTGRTRHEGQSDNWYTAKYAVADGALLWERETHLASQEESEAIAVDGGGDVVFLGSSYDGTNLDYHVVKYAAANGAPVWTKVIRSYQSNGSSALAVDGSGNVVVNTIAFLGNNEAGFPDYGRRTIKFAAADGAVLWENRSGELGETALAVDAAGNVMRGSARGCDESGNCFYYMARHAAADGAIVWEKNFTDPWRLGGDGEFSLLAMDGSGNVALLRTVGNALNRPDFHTAKYAAADGALIWEKHYSKPDGFSDHTLRAMTLDGGGNMVVTGTLASPRPGGGFQTVGWTARYAAANGALIWEQRTSTPVDSSIVAHAVTVDAGGNVAVSGTYNRDGAEFGNDFYTARYAAPNGALLWEKFYNGPANSEDKAQAVAMDSGGNVIVTGISYSGIYPYNGVSAYTAKYAAASGALLWESRSAGGQAVVVDSSGNVIVSGSGLAKLRPDGTTAWGHDGGGRVIAVDAAGNVIVGTSDGYLRTAKYAAATGALLWEKRRTTENGYLSAVAVDAGGNVIVAGTTNGSDSGHDFYTAKYAGADGALLWEQRFSGLGESPDVASALVVDASGNVVVTGFSRYGYTDQFTYYHSDYNTVKFAAANGALLWQRRYDSWDSGDDFANAVAVDTAGNVVVTGSSAMGAGEWFGPANTYTAKYAAADGALLWERREGGGASALVLDPSGNAVVTGVRNDGFYTAKYAASDGAKLWGRGYSRPNAYAGSVMGSWDLLSPNPEGMGDSHSLALGPDGTIAIAGTVDGDPGPRGNYDFATILYREIPGPVSFAAWAAGFGLTGAEAAPSADPDHDGIPNAAEYIPGGNPVSSALPRLPAATISGGNMIFTFARDDLSETPDVSVTVETSTDLVSWPQVIQAIFFIGSNTADSSGGVTISENGTAPDTIIVAIPLGTDKTKFARLKVTVRP